MPVPCRRPQSRPSRRLARSPAQSQASGAAIFGRLCHGSGGPEGGDRRRRGLMLTILSRVHLSPLSKPFPCESRNARAPSARKVNSGCCQAARGFWPWAELHRNQQGLGTTLPLAECGTDTYLVGRGVQTPSTCKSRSLTT